MVSEVYKNNHVFKNIWVKIEKCRYGSYLRESTKYICKNYINPPPSQIFTYFDSWMSYDRFTQRENAALTFKKNDREII